MAQEVRNEPRYRLIGIAVVSVAVVGWLLSLYFWSAWASAENELERHLSLTGTSAEIEDRIVSLQSEAEGVEIARDYGAGEMEQLQERLETARADVAELDTRAQALRAERETLESELVAGREEMAALEEGIEQARQEVADTSQEFSDVGERLDEGRRREAELQTRLADMTAEIAQLSADASGAEERIQAAREAESSLEQEVVSARQELEEIEDTRDTVDQSLAVLVQRRGELATDAVAAEEQMQAIQDVVVELSRTLAERSEHLAELERRIAELQQEAGEPARAAAAGLMLGRRYLHGPVTATFEPDGTFQMENTRTREAVAGVYALSEDLLTLSEVEGDLRAAAFPMRCGIIAQAAGFALEDVDGSCTFLSDISFERAAP